MSILMTSASRMKGWRRGHGVLGERLLGSTSEHVGRLAEMPVLVAH